MPTITTTKQPVVTTPEMEKEAKRSEARFTVIHHPTAQFSNNDKAYKDAQNCYWNIRKRSWHKLSLGGPRSQSRQTEPLKPSL